MLTPAASSSRRLRIAAIGLRGLPSAYSGLERSSGDSTPSSRGAAEITVYCRPEYVPAPEPRIAASACQSAPALKRRSLDTLSHVTASTLHALVRSRHDVIHLHALAPGLLAPLCRLAGVPVVGTGPRTRQRARSGTRVPGCSGAPSAGWCNADDHRRVARPAGVIAERPTVTPRAGCRTARPSWSPRTARTTPPRTRAWRISASSPAPRAVRRTVSAGEARAGPHHRIPRRAGAATPRDRRRGGHRRLRPRAARARRGGSAHHLHWLPERHRVGRYR